MSSCKRTGDEHSEIEKKTVNNPFIVEKIPTFAESLFYMECNLSSEFPHLDPLTLDKCGFIDVMELYINTRKMQMERETQQENADKPKMIPATTNDW